MLHDGSPSASRIPVGIGGDGPPGLTMGAPRAVAAPSRAVAAELVPASSAACVLEIDSGAAEHLSGASQGASSRRDRRKLRTVQHRRSRRGQAVGVVVRDGGDRDHSGTGSSTCVVESGSTAGGSLEGRGVDVVASVIEGNRGTSFVIFLSVGFGNQLNNGT